MSLMNRMKSTGDALLLQAKKFSNAENSSEQNSDQEEQKRDLSKLGGKKLQKYAIKFYK